MTAPRRKDRLAEFVRQEVATILLREMRDPRFAGVTVTRAEVSDDIQHARVFIRVIGPEAATRTAMRALSSAAGKIQSELGARMQTRYTPHLTFAIDEDVEKERRLLELFRKVAEERGEAPAEGGDGEPGPAAG